MRKNYTKLFLGLFIGIMMVFCLTTSVFAYKNQIVTRDGKQYYYNDNGKLVKSRYGIQINKKWYLINSKGVMKQVSEVKGRAGYLLDKWRAKGITKKSKLLAEAFKWSAKLPFVSGTTVPSSGVSVIEWYGLYGFRYQKGNCFNQAGTFAWMAKVLGYDVDIVSGYVPTAVDKNGKITKFSTHGWATIKYNGKLYVFDPNFSAYCMANPSYNSQVAAKTGNKAAISQGWMFQYGDKGHYRYCNSKKVEIRK
ncbi:MAG: transglutaminase domain-containing protein [Blautia sp.]|nr:transglutaminase domain-containing protein [Blautia sp.]